MSTNAILAFQPHRQFGQGVPYGNVTDLVYVLETAGTTGAVKNAQTAGTTSKGDTVILGEIPAGFRIDSVKIVFEAAMTASVTLNIGYKSLDGQTTEATHFAAAAATTAGVRDLTAKLPHGFEAPVNLLVTVTSTEDNVAAAKMAIILQGVHVGVK